MLVESARIARGGVKSLAELDSDNYSVSYFCKIRVFSFLEALELLRISLTSHHKVRS